MAKYSFKIINDSLRSDIVRNLYYLLDLIPNIFQLFIPKSLKKLGLG
jgi:hypothetical protein